MEIKNIKVNEFVRQNDGYIMGASNLASFVFRSFGWTWGIMEPKIPTNEEIYKQYLDLIQLCIKSNTHMISTGRLVVDISLSKKKGDKPQLSLYLDLC
jgi:hypothetical protein